MGEQRVSLVKNEEMHDFMRHLLKDVQALRYMLDNDWFESDTIRIGAEQEMVLVDLETYKPATIAPAMLEKLSKYEWADGELARFQSRNQPDTPRLQGQMPQPDGGRECPPSADHPPAGAQDGSGSCPDRYSYLRCASSTWECITSRRATAILHFMEAINSQLIGSTFELRLAGIDELLVKHDSPLAGSLQYQLPGTPAGNARFSYVQMYNISSGARRSGDGHCRQLPDRFRQATLA